MVSFGESPQSGHRLHSSAVNKFMNLVSASRMLFPRDRFDSQTSPCKDRKALLVIARSLIYDRCILYNMHCQFQRSVIPQLARSPRSSRRERARHPRGASDGARWEALGGAGVACSSKLLVQISLPSPIFTCNVTCIVRPAHQLHVAAIGDKSRDLPL